MIFESDSFICGLRLQSLLLVCGNGLSRQMSHLFVDVLEVPRGKKKLANIENLIALT